MAPKTRVAMGKGIIIKQLFIFDFKLVNNLLLHCFISYKISRGSPINTYLLKDCEDINVIIVNTSASQISVLYIRLKMFNDLPIVLKQASGLYIFKKLITRQSRVILHLQYPIVLKRIMYLSCRYLAKK